MSSTSSHSHATIGDTALELIKELTANPDILPLFREELMKQCKQQIGELYDLNCEALRKLRNGESREIEEKAMTMVRARQLAIERIKRCCCAYSKVRIERLKSLRWKSGGQLPSGVRANLSKNELKWLNEYNSAVFKYQDGFGESGLNLLEHIGPPQSLHIFVRAIKDHGKFETCDGVTVCLTKDSMHFLSPRDCENLIRRGVLEPVD